MKDIDIPKQEDLSFAVMNLISIEEHLAFTFMKTGKVEYLSVLDSVRSLRKYLLKQLLVNTEGELWCVSKHLLATSMRLMETGAKFLEKDVKNANKFYKSAFDVYSLFWLLQKVGGKGSRTGKKAKKVEEKL